MATAIQHRGPDDSGLWTDAEGGIALAHRRLSIVDLSPAGHQPMASGSGRFVIAFNGEIYNHLTIRSELQSVGAAPAWKGRSDTETLLAAFEHWGISTTLTKTIGMFALALWDRHERRLYLIRDRMGEKPLYYGWCNGAFVFGSELKALRQYPGFTYEIDGNSLCLYLRYNYIPAPYSIYKNVFKLEPGCVLSLVLKDTCFRPERSIRAPISNGTLQLHRWWSLHEVVESSRSSLISSEKEALRLLETHLRESVRLQSVADVPLGAFLSGGIDSSLIAALMQSQASTAIHTFTIGFKESDYDESTYARSVARHLQTDHTDLFVSAADAMSVIPSLPAIYDEPFADSSQIPTFLLSQLTRKHVTVSLSGDGGDELFGGYNRHLRAPALWNSISKIPFPGRLVLSKTLHRIPLRVLDSLGHIMPRPYKTSFLGQKLHRLADRLMTVDNSDDLYYSLVSEFNDPDEIVLGGKEPATLLTERTAWPALPAFEDRMMYLDAMTYLPDDILVKVDRAAMSASLETRVPFLDHRLVELAWRMPLSIKIRNGQGKLPLRNILYQYVPRQLIERPKHGFGIPVGLWLRGPLRDWAESLLDEARLKREGVLNAIPVRSRWQEHLSGRRNWEHSLWSILMFQAWLEAN